MLNDADYFDFLSKDAYFDGTYHIVRKIDRVVNRQDASLNVFKCAKGFAPLYAYSIICNNIC